MELDITHQIYMQLQGQSDASYLSRPRAKSVCGGLFYLGSRDAINGPIVCTSKMISSVVASAAEVGMVHGKKKLFCYQLWEVETLYLGRGVMWK